MRLKLDSAKWIFVLQTVASGSKKGKQHGLKPVFIINATRGNNLWLQNNFQSYRSLWEKHNCPRTL